MQRWKSIGIAAIALSASLAFAQDAPQSLLPPGFDDPEPAENRPPPPPPTRPSTGAAPAPSVSGVPSTVVAPAPGVSRLPPELDLGAIDLSGIPSLEELEGMSTDEIDEILGLKPSYDIPPAARRSLERVGILDMSEGGFAPRSLARQPAVLVRAILAGTDGPMVSRWGHILLRRALASRLEAPAGMSPVEFAALRGRILNSMGEHAVARALVQDVDTGNWNDALTDTALDAYIGTADIIGACPAIRLLRSERDDATQTMLQAICNSYAGETVRGGRQLDRALGEEIAPRIDILLAQRFAGAAGRGRRAVDVEWDGVEDLNPWRFALANALGEEIPEGLRAGAGPYYQRIWATAPMLALPQRAVGADRAAREGIISASAMVDLYSRIYADDTITGESADLAVTLRESYVASDPADRLSAMQEIWGDDRAEDYGRYVLTAYAAARIPASAEFADEAAPLISSMLTAGLDRDMLAWNGFVPSGGQAWAQIALANPSVGANASSDAIDNFLDDDGSAELRRSKFLIAGLAGLGRISNADRSQFSERLGINLARSSKWTRLIGRAAEVDNAALVALLAGLGMQGTSWEKMTPLHLYHIVSALDRVGLNSEARMIAAEAVARG
jgi:hypothetical protein